MWHQLTLKIGKTSDGAAVAASLFRSRIARTESDLISTFLCKLEHHQLNYETKTCLQIWRTAIFVDTHGYGLRTPNEGINQRNLKFWADVADKICFGRT